MKKTVCLIRGIEEECDHDAAGNPYAIPYYIGFCGSTGYTGGTSWDYFVEPLDIEKADCPECLDAYALFLLGDVP